ncbi:MAG: hypothetical protein JNJ61_25390 [Anaerolineae bacterium]|nr:hypothetical protein [Anaerolineae bacterium]
MSSPPKREYRYLDSDDDRRALIEDIRQVRRDVLRMLEIVPKDKWYEPRYHGISLAAMLGHLQLMDSVTLWMMQLALIGVRLPGSAGLVNRFNDFMGRVFRQRVIETTVKGIQTKETALISFVEKLPVEQFSKLVYHPVIEQYLTVEQAVQEFFLFHWREHLASIRAVDDVRYEPPARDVL